MNPITYENRTRTYELLSMDVTRHCNARCKFCFNDWKKLSPAVMNEETFRKVLTLLPLVPEDGFYLSCLFEPSIYPAFFHFLKLIPKEYRSKVFFTTNLVTRLTGEQIQAVFDANIDHVNVSLETFDPGIYQELTGVRRTSFYENLTAFAEAAKGSKVKLRLITMMLNSTKDELIETVQKAHELYAPFEHEIRTPFPFEADEKQVAEYAQELMTKEEVGRLCDGLMGLGYSNLQISAGWDQETYRIYQMGNQKKSKQKETIRKTKYDIRIEADGRVHFGGTDRYFDLKNISNPPEWFQKELAVLQKEETDRFFEGQCSGRKLHIEKKRAYPFSIDEAVLYDGHFLHIRGWDAYSVTGDAASDRVLIFKCGFKNKICHVISTQRMDVVQAMHDEQLLWSGFETCVETSPEELKRAKLYMGYRKEDDIYAFLLS